MWGKEGGGSGSRSQGSLNTAAGHQAQVSASFPFVGGPLANLACPAFWTILRPSLLQGNWGHWLQHVHTFTQPQGQKRRHMIRQRPWPALRPLLFTSPVACSLLRLREWMCLDAPGLGAGRSSFHSAPAMQILADPSPSLDLKSPPPCTVAKGWGCIGGIGWSLRLSPFSFRL